MSGVELDDAIGCRNHVWRYHVRLRTQRKQRLARTSDEGGRATRPKRPRDVPRVRRDNKLDRGGHFAAWEQPQLLSEEVRAGFRPLRH
jgi:hypothetical protein